MFLDKDIINKIYNLIIWLKQKKMISVRGYIEKNIIIHQPELSNNASIVVWGQCIRAKIYKKAINIYGKRKYSIYLTYYEDTIMNHIIYQISKSSTSIQNYGILYWFKIRSTRNTITERERDFSVMKYIEIMLDFSRNTFELKKKL